MTQSVAGIVPLLVRFLIPPSKFSLSLWRLNVAGRGSVVRPLIASRQLVAVLYIKPPQHKRRPSEPYAIYAVLKRGG